MGLETFEVAGWILSAAFLVDSFAYLRFFPPSYVLGCPILIRKMPQLARPLGPVGQGRTTAHGIYRLVSSDRALLRERFSLIDSRGWGLRVVLDWSSGAPSATARISLVYALGLVGAWAAAVIASRTHGEPGYLEWVVPPVVIAIFAAMWIERAQLLLREYVEAEGPRSHT